jgi:hypothetical protein
MFTNIYRLDERQSVDGSSTRRDPISPQARAMYIGNNLAGQNNYGSLSPGGAASSGLGTSSYRVSPDPEPSTKAQRNRPNSTKRRRKSGHQRISGAPASNVSLKPLRPISSAQPSPYSSIQPSLGGASIGAQKKEQRIARGDEYLYHGPTDLPPRSSSTNPLGGVGPSGSSASAAREYTDEEIDRVRLSATMPRSFVVYALTPYVSDSATSPTR